MEGKRTTLPTSLHLEKIVFNLHLRVCPVSADGLLDVKPSARLLVSLVAERHYPSPIVGSRMSVTQAFPRCIGDLLGLSKVRAVVLIQNGCLVSVGVDCWQTLILINLKTSVTGMNLIHDIWM